MVPQNPFTSSLPELYERFLVGPLFRVFAEELLDRVGLGEDHRILDVACGTGIVARLARQRLGDRGRIVGVDASPAMIAIAQSVAPAIDWRHGDAAQLPAHDDERFDIVTCHQGLQFFRDRPAAIREMRRVLAPRGRLALATWRPVEEVPLVADLQRVAERHLGPVVDQRHCMGDATIITGLLADAGFHAIQVETVTRTVRMSDGADTFAQLNTMAIVGMSHAAKRMTEEQRAQAAEAIVNDSIAALQPYVEGGDLVFDLSSNIAISQGGAERARRDRDASAER
jgi:ubiquinone/menaquinone biosynthesis C-methylase UbiE